MTTDTSALSRMAWETAALQAVSAAGKAVAAAKRNRSAELVDIAQQELQDAVDAARDLDVEWGQIGIALGIARGNAYQRYRRKPTHGTFRAAAGDHRHHRA
jgi:hypothetical protein